ncbi:ABC transporter substrate-binding protein [Pseudomonas sp. TH41]|uniref:ABC transporter substrate-binding protein n=1 Tax=Pseudomonas sp. TH41 TaxID=2796405 RepID=UPI00191283DE|nr:ABC transporter substrate-binding protein [Pseudomonas sp. TH41]MBK5354504.1 ABC transporter substrate-binding protein [Pseudomonas sp. TH41]
MKYVAGAIFLSLGLASCMAGAADIASMKPSFIQGDTLKVCTAGEFPPMEFYAKPGDTQMVGFEVDVMNALARHWGVATQLVVGDFKGLLPSLDSKRCDLVASGMTITTDRLKRYDGVGYFKSAKVMVTSTRDEHTRTPEDLSGKVIAIEAGTTYEGTVTALNKQLVENGRQPISMQTYPSASAVIQQVLVGRAAATITQDTTAAYRSSQLPGQLQITYTYPDAELFGLYLRKDAADLQALKGALGALQQSGELKALLTKWNLPAMSTDVQLAQQ